MSIDLPSFSAFALQSRGAPASAPGDGQTLTLSPGAKRPDSAPRPGGSLSMHAVSVALPGNQHAGVVAPPECRPLTITF